MQTNRKMGMITMDDCIQQIYFANRISKETAVQFAVDPDAMENKLF
jgi:twitching motility protein PilT